MRMRTRKTGDWKGPLRWIRMARAALAATAEAMMEEVTQNASKDLVARIQAQSLPLAPLSSRYLAFKLMKGLDPRILIATGDYTKAMGSFRVSKWVWGVGLPSGKHKPSRLTYAQLWEILEFGTALIPARPHVRPVARDAAEEIPKAIVNYGFVYLGRTSM